MTVVPMGQRPITAARPKPLTIRTLGELLNLDVAARENLLGSWLTQRHLNMTYAPAGVGKSMFAMSCALAVAGGGSYLDWKAPKPRKVLIVDGEMDTADLRDRAKVLMAALPDCDAALASENLSILAQQDQPVETKFPDLATNEGRDEVVGIAVQMKAELVILDNFSTLATIEDENKANSFDPIISLMQTLKMHGMACILIHHSKKGGGAGKHSEGGYRGTSKMAVTFNSIISLAHPEGVPSIEGTAFSLHWEKFRGVRDGEVVDLKASLGKDAKEWTCETTYDGNIAKLVRLVRSRKFPTQGDLATELGVSAGTVSAWKTKAIATGIITMGEWKACLSDAAELREDVEEEADQPF